MMIAFMVLALPRCGTTWAANWLTTDTTLCLHDPLYEHHYSMLDGIKTAKRLGVSCTGLYNFPEWVNAHPAKKLILHRPLGEINDSMNAIGLHQLTKTDEKKLRSIEGLHVDWRDLFDDPADIYEWLIEKSFDAERHEQLKQIEMQPLFSGVTINTDVTKRLVEEISNAVRR